MGSSARRAAVIGGDALSQSIAAASIVAKTLRDALMARPMRDIPDTASPVTSATRPPSTQALGRSARAPAPPLVPACSGDLDEALETLLKKIDEFVDFVENRRGAIVRK